jgi:hypothetical protein
MRAIMAANLHYFDGGNGPKCHEHSRQLHIVHVVRKIRHVAETRGYKCEQRCMCNVRFCEFCDASSARCKEQQGEARVSQV